MARNPRYECRVCNRWTIRRGTDNTRRIGYTPSLCKVCLDCYVQWDADKKRRRAKLAGTSQEKARHE